MAIIQSGANSTVLQTVDPTMTASRITIRPSQLTGSYEVGLVSANLTGVAAGAPVFAFRWAPPISTKLCLIRRIELGFSTITAFTTAQALQYSLQVARQWTTNDTGGITASFAQTNTGKDRTSMPTSSFAGGGQITIASTTALVAGSRTLDSQAMSYSSGTSNGIGTTMPNTAIMQQQTGDYPLIFSENEGFIINNVQTMGAAGVINLYINLEWFEMDATTGDPIAF